MTNPHDAFFKESFSRREHAADFLAGVLPAPLKAKLDLDTLRLENASYIDERLAEHFSDLVYACAWRGKTEIRVTLLFEHKSFVPKHPHVQLLRYLVGMWETQIKQQGALTPVIPLVVYHGKQRWRYRPLGEYFEGIEEDLLPFLPEFRYLLFDLSRFSDEEVKSAVFRQAGVKIAILLMKKIFDEEGLRKALGEIFGIGRHFFEKGGGLRFLESVLRYLYERVEISPEELVEVLKPITREGSAIAMSTAEKLIEQGKLEGFREGKIEGFREGKIEALIEMLQWTHPDLALRFEKRIEACRSLEELAAVKAEIRRELEARKQGSPR